jgi:hypothetical protein
MVNNNYAATPNQQQTSNPSRLRSAATGATGFASGIVGYNAGEHFINKGLARLGTNHKFTRFMNSGHKWLTPKHVAASLAGAGVASLASGVANKVYNRYKAQRQQ